METKWVNLLVHCPAATMLSDREEMPAYLKIGGFAGREIGPQFHGMAALGIDAATCPRCGVRRTALVCEGVISNSTSGDLPEVELQTGSRGSLRNDPEGDFYVLTSWSGRPTGLLSGPSVMVRYCPPPPGAYTEHLYEGQTLKMYSVPVVALPTTEYGVLCPACRTEEDDCNN